MADELNNAPAQSAEENGDLLATETQAAPVEGAAAEAAGKADEAKPAEAQTEKPDDGDLLDTKELEKEIQEREGKAPEKYEDFKLPENFTLSEEAKADVADAFRSLGLSQSKAQALIDMHCKYLMRNATEASEHEAAMTAEWKNTVRSRPEYEAERPLALRGMRALVQSPEEIALFRDSPLRNHPAMWSLMVKAGRLVSEDNLGRGSGTAPSGEERFHVNLATL